LCGQLATERIGGDVVDKRLGAVDLDYGKQLAVPLLELGVVRDVDLVQLESELRAQLLQRRAGPLA
jgi:hypothetical protein